MQPSLSRFCLMISCFLVSAALSSTGVARQWQLPGAGPVEAELVGMDASGVTLASKGGKRVRIRITELAEADLQYVCNVIALQQATMSNRSLELQQKSVDILRQLYMSQWYDLWQVQFMGPRGPFWQLIPARDSFTAMDYARRQYPQASILWVKRFRRRG